MFWARGNGGWSQVAYLKASNAEAADRFGWSVTAGEHTALVGADGEASHASGLNGNQSNNLWPLAGAGYAFERDSGVWRQSAYIKSSNTTRADFFGRDVALAGDTFFLDAARGDGSARGINGANNNRRPDSGAAYAHVLPAARVALRNAGTNPSSYRATPAILGGLWSVRVDLAAGGHPLALVRGFAEADERPLPGGQVLLVSGAPLFQSALQQGHQRGSWSARVPDVTAIAGLRLYTQAIHFGGDRPFVLSNAQDLVVGF